MHPPTDPSSVSPDSVATGPYEAPTGTAAGPGPPLGIPKQIGRFPVTGVLGSGAFGRVFRATDPQLGRDVAIKVPLSSAVATPAARDRFLREARAAAALRHPNICPVHEVGEEAGTPYIVMGFVPGQTLAAVLKARAGCLPEAQAAVIVRKLAMALDSAHRTGIVHRDLKPANVMFDRDRKEVVLTDFGLARAPGLGDTEATRDGVIMGTPAYMSPEQARGDTRAVGPASDQFALGVMLYEMLAGRRPFTGTVAEVIGQVQYVEPEPPSRFRPGLDPRLESACRKAMAKDPAARFASMKEFAAAVDAVLRSPAGAGDMTGGAPEPAGANSSAARDASLLADLFAAARAGHKKATAAAVDRAARTARTPPWVVVLGSLLAIGALTALGCVIYFDTSRGVSVRLDMPVDPGLGYLLDGEPVAPENLTGPMELGVGEHELVVRRAGEVVKRVHFVVRGGWRPSAEILRIEEPSP